MRLNHFTKNDTKVIRLIAITWIITKLICYNLWLAERLFPLVPIHTSLSLVPAFFHTLIFAVSIAGMVWFLFFPRKKIMIAILLMEILSCCLDQNRWQPWEYQFLFMGAAYVMSQNEKQTIILWQLIITGLFFFSGLFKFNSSFIHDVWQHLILNQWLGITNPGINLVRAGYCLPLLEMLSALGLYFTFTRKASVLILCAMHLFILLLLGPIGLNINAVVWPWNLLMIGLLFLILYRHKIEITRAAMLHRLTWVILLFWWTLPWLQLAGYWDKYLSSVLYGGGVEQLYICVNNIEAQSEMAGYIQHKFWLIPCSSVLPVFNWGVKEMKTAPYPEPRIYKAIIKEWEKRYPNSRSRYFIYRSGFAPSLTEMYYP
ncbi:MAG: hypothetical protein ABIO04_02205 [Ferruginibacter sp.]